MIKYRVILEIESESNPAEWYWGDTVVIDEEVTLLSSEEVSV